MKITSTFQISVAPVEFFKKVSVDKLPVSALSVGEITMQYYAKTMSVGS